MNPHLHRFAIAAIVALATTAACMEVDGTNGPDEVAEEVCERFIQCYMEDDFSSPEERDEWHSDCVQLHAGEYAQIESQKGAACHDAHLETERCFTRQSCEDWTDGVGCEVEMEREEELCGETLS